MATRFPTNLNLPVRLEATPPLVSDSSNNGSGISPSQIARSPQLFEDWAFHARVCHDHIMTPEVAAFFDNLYRLEALPFVLSQEILQKPSLDNEVDFLNTIRQWALSLPTTEDQYGVSDELHILAMAHSRIKRASNTSAQERRGIDDIIELAFSKKVDRSCDYSTEESFRLVGLDSNPDARADTLVTISADPAIQKVDYFRFRLDKVTGNQMFWSTSVPTRFSIIGFAGEFKNDDIAQNKNQLEMVLLTAQSQRKALALKDSIIMGAVSSRGNVQIYSSCWGRDDDSLLHIFEHQQTFNLTDPVQVIHLFIFLSRLQEHLQRTFALELQEWNPPSAEAIKKHTWRSSDRKPESDREGRSPGRKRRRTTEAGSMGGSSSSGGGVMDANDLYDSRFVIMKWRDAVEGTKEVMALSGAGEVPQGFEYDPIAV